MPEQVILSGKEFCSDPNCVLHKSGVNLMISLKKHLIRTLDLKHRDIVKIYIVKVGHDDNKPRKVNTLFTLNEQKIKTADERTDMEKKIAEMAETPPLILTENAKKLVKKYKDATLNSERDELFKLISEEVGGNNLARIAIEL